MRRLPQPLPIERRSADPIGPADPAWLARAGAGEPRRIPGGARLWVAGQPADHFALIERGVVQVEHTTPAGNGVILGLFGPADSIGLPSVLGRGPHTADAIALTDPVEILRIGAAPMLDALPGSAPLAIAVNHALLRHASILRSKIDIVSAGSVPRRLAALFVHLARRFGHATGHGSIRIEPGLTREQISQFVGARAETVIRIVSRWQKAGWLASGRDGIEIARFDMLRRIHGR